MIKKFQNLTIQTKLVSVFVVSMVIILCVNIFMFSNVNRVVTQLDEIYISNVNLNDLADALSNVQNSMTTYLNTKSTDSMEAYYKDSNTFDQMLLNFNVETTSNEIKLMEKNIYFMSKSYLDLTVKTIEAKRGRNVERYRKYYDESKELYEYVGTYIYSLNNKQFRTNTNSYMVLSFSLNYLEIVSSVILIAVALSNIFMIILVTRTITNPLQSLVQVANQVGSGDFEVELLEASSKDEVGVVSNAFNKMVISIRIYIERIKQNMETERVLKEKELRMEAHLKDAQLKYLQAQINPHFLFNTLNAGAQLAMMEDADRTYEYVQKVAELFRYNMKKNNELVTLKEELDLVDIYIYILNVRFSGEIHFHKRIDDNVYEILQGTYVPSMILQPIIENSINYGIRNITWQGIITLSIYIQYNQICVSIKDNGIGIPEQKISRILNGELTGDDVSKESNGIGLDNVINRLKLFNDTEDVMDIVSEGENLGTEVIIYIAMK